MYRGSYWLQGDKSPGQWTGKLEIQWPSDVPGTNVNLRLWTEPCVLWYFENFVYKYYTDSSLDFVPGYHIINLVLASSLFFLIKIHKTNHYKSGKELILFFPWGHSSLIRNYDHMFAICKNALFWCLSQVLTFQRWQVSRVIVINFFVYSNQRRVAKEIIEKFSLFLLHAFDAILACFAFQTCKSYKSKIYKILIF